MVTMVIPKLLQGHMSWMLYGSTCLKPLNKHPEKQQQVTTCFQGLSEAHADPAQLQQLQASHLNEVTL